MNEKIEVPTMQVPPLKKICMTIGQLPTSYLNSMTYYEMLLWFVNYLRDDIIPVVNANGEATHELQKLYVELQSYVNNYFDDLDVQEEIDNKLEAMAESGELTDIIAQYLGLAGMITFDTVADMKLAENLVNGSKCCTLGYHSINDGGKAIYKVRTITNEDVVDEGSIIALYDNTLIAELIERDKVTPEMFGAYGDNSHDDYQAIQKAIDYIDGGVVELQSKIYIVGDTLTIHRGVKLTGLSSYDATNSTLKLKDNSNKAILQTQGNTATGNSHFVIIENLFFDGNFENQTSEANLVEIIGSFVGTVIRNCRIGHFYGTGLHVKNCDMQIDGLWILNGYTETGRYAFDTNQNYTTEITNMIDADNLYIENYRTTLDGDPSTTPSIRAKGLHLFRNFQFNGNELHFENIAVPVTIEQSNVISVKCISSSYCGNTSTDNAFIYIKTALPESVAFFNIAAQYNDIYTHVIKVDENISNAMYREIAQTSYVPMYIANSSSDMKQFATVNKLVASNEMNIVKTGNPSTLNYTLKATSGDARFRTNGDYYYEIGSTMNQPGSAFKVFQQFKSFGTAGDDILFFTPIQLAERDTAASVPKDNLYMYKNGSNNYPVYQRVSGTNDGMNRVVTTRIGTAAPSATPLYAGEMYLDTSNQKLYVATGTSSSSDWIILN